MLSTPVRLNRILSSASDGMLLAEDVLHEIEQDENTIVSLDFNDVEYITPSYANAFVMTILGQLSAERFDRQIRLLHCSDYAQTAIDKSRSRFERGIRLSTQR